MRIILTVSFIFFACIHCRASGEQADTTALMPAVMRLANAGDSLLKSRDSLVRVQNTRLFESLLDSLLALPAGRSLSFAQVKALSVATSNDTRVRMLTWMVRFEWQGRQSFRYFGYLLHRTTPSAVYTALKLMDCGARDHDSLAFFRIQAPEWVGGICYAIVQNRSSKSASYLLLNWSPQNEQITRKTAETLQLRDNKAIFGVPLIRAGGKSRGRLVFDYNAQASMTMRYDERMNKVVMDHLSPSDLRPEARNQYQLYGPDLSYDALSPEKGQWILLRDIDVRNR